ncbi:DUF445 family protein [Flammeovirga yaeyamensis]|uniref:DUF445 family protein n=1 Tax=Flammeovirga yaeyamensis TaxID=367791 RepID=A0AAX1MYC6_9BACT|nr:DUF445 family protein [Flammeovirga yaeyamensis]MBB3696244.1 uncharacterized membrane protein YheB (UPF0754 family) [Flammeovirga yaeyamensis]NMF34925.1 DUF445 family protein [Flammeovirga yaeyamensis]QWG00250.1 DUF445 family protein [Flammeovirga yaeyamensis]
MNYLVWSFPLISAGIGWITNYVAIKMLFHPRKPINLGLFKLHGVFPRRKETLARRLGVIVEKDLFTPDMIVEKLNTEENKSKLRESIMKRINEFVDEKAVQFGPMLQMFGGDAIIDQIRNGMEKSVDEMIPKLMEDIGNNIGSISIEQVVYEKVMDFSDEKFEDLLMAVIKSELRFIEIMGAVLGFLIGLVQVALLTLF